MTELDPKQIEEAVQSIEARWPEAVAQAKQWQPGMMRSAWTMPLEALVGEREHIIRQLGDDPATMPVPKSMRADANEKALPGHVRDAYRRGNHLHGRIPKALDRRVRAIAKAAQQKRGGK